MGIEFLENFEELELDLQFLLNFSHEWELEWESPWFLDQLLISGIGIFGVFECEFECGIPNSHSNLKFNFF